MNLIQLLKFKTWETRFSKCLIWEHLISKWGVGLQLPLGYDKYLISAVPNTKVSHMALPGKESILLKKMDLQSIHCNYFTSKLIYDIIIYSKVVNTECIVHPDKNAHTKLYLKIRMF